MIQDNEVLALCITIGVLLLVFIHRSYLSRLPGFKLLLSSPLLLLVAWILSIFEGFFYPDLTNLIEHLFYLGSAVTMSCWFFFFGACHEKGER